MSDAIANVLNIRLADDEHKFDGGPPRVWHIYRPQTLYAFVHTEFLLPVGIAEASGPHDCANAGWWIDSKFRAQGYGNELVDLLAASLKQQGFTSVGRIVIDTFGGRYNDASMALAKRFKSHF